MPTFTNIDGEEPSTVTFTVAAVSLSRNSSAELQEILCLGDPEVASSLGIARVTAAAPASTNAALNVRIVSGPSSLADFPVRVAFPSTATDNPVSAAQASTVWAVQLTQYSTTVQVSSVGGAVIVRSSAADMNVTVAGYSTTVNVSSLAGAVIVRSSAADFAATISGNVGQASTVWQTQAALRTSSGGGLEGSTLMPVNGTLGLNVRQVYPTILSTGRSTAGNNSTSLELVSSVAAQRVKVFAYSITSTSQDANDVSFYSSAAHLLWPIVLRSVSSAVTGANLSVNPPAWLFATAPANALNFNVTGSTGTYKVAISYFQEA